MSLLRELHQILKVLKVLVDDFSCIYVGLFSFCLINTFDLLNTKHLGFLAEPNTYDALTEFFDKAYE